MTKLKQDKIVVVALTLMASLLLTALTGRFWANDIKNQAELLLLVQQVSQGAALATAESKGLLQDSQALVAVQQVNDSNIAAFQLLINGSVKRNLPSVADLTGQWPDAASQQFAAFQSIVSELLQSRTTLERILRGRDDLIQASTRLAAQSESLADGLEQQGFSLDHLRVAYRIKMALLAHAQAVREAYATGSGAPALPLELLRTDLKSLSTDNTAPASPTIRRTAANLLSLLEEHAKTLTALDEHNHATEKLRTRLTDLHKQSVTLQQLLEGVSGVLYAFTPVWLYLTLTFSLIALGSAIALGYWLRAKLLTPASQAPIVTPTAHPERTSPNFLTLLKTEKNLLMNDIKPIADGILHIKADEHLETTGDLARCLNQSREALVRRIDLLKRKVIELQEALNDQAGEEAVRPLPQIEAVSADEKSQLVDLTFKGHAALDGLQRHLRQQHNMEADDCKQLLQRCQSAERVLDEIRVRIKKIGEQTAITSATEIKVASTPTSKENATAHHSAQREKIDALVGRLVEHLDEIQTQPTKTRRAKQPPGVST